MQLHFETRRSGLTLVELLVAMLSASVLVLTMGAVLYYGIRGWSSTSEVAELQRDGAFAVDMLSRTVQASSYHEISVDARPGISFITNHVRNTPAAFYLDADGALVYDPDTTAGGAQDLVPPGRGFNCRNGDVVVHSGESLPGDVPPGFEPEAVVSMARWEEL